MKKQTTPRINKSKEQIMAEMKQLQKVQHIKGVVRKIFPLLDVDSIYDAQTVLNALQGFIKVDLEEKLDAIKISDLKMDFGKEKDTKIRIAMDNIVEVCKDEQADDFSQIAERLSRAFADFGSQKFLKGPMNTLSLDEILSE